MYIFLFNCFFLLYRIFDLHRCFFVTDIDECASAPCQNDGTCIDLENSFKCNCSKAWEGNLCQFGMLCNIKFVLLQLFLRYLQMQTNVKQILASMQYHVPIWSATITASAVSDGWVKTAIKTSTIASGSVNMELLALTWSTITTVLVNQVILVSIIYTLQHKI